MDGIILLVVAVAALIMVMAALGMPLSAIIKASKLPASAKFNPKNSWGIEFFDKNLWVKVVLIKLGQAVIVCGLFFINFVWAAIKAAGSAFVKALEGAAKSPAKKAVKK